MDFELLGDWTVERRDRLLMGHYLEIPGRVFGILVPLRNWLRFLDHLLLLLIERVQDLALDVRGGSFLGILW